MKIPTKYLLIFLVVLIVLVIIVSYFIFKKRWAKIPEGVEIPSGWDPTAQTVTLHDCMAGPGTDETTIFAILQSINKAQLAMIYNKFREMYNDSLIQWFSDEFSGDDLQRALAFFSGIQGVEKTGLIRGGGGRVLRFLRSVASRNDEL